MKLYLLLGLIFALFGVVLGAFGAHGLKNAHLAPELIQTYEVGVRYQFYHAFALIVVFILQKINDSESRKQVIFTGLNWAGRCFVVGIALFSGSLYLLACREWLPFPVLWAGPLTPLGGVFFIVGWFLMARASLHFNAISHE